MWEFYNPNPINLKTGDCSVRAIAKALDTTWEDAYSALSVNGFLMGDIPNANHVIGSVLRQHGFKRFIVPNECPDCYTAEDFCQDHPEGTYVVFFQNHVACIKDGILYDSWDSSQETPLFYWTNNE